MLKDRTTGLLISGFLLALAVIVGAAAYQSWQIGRGPTSVLWGIPQQTPFGEQDRIFGTVPEFSFVERSGRLVGLSDLRGKVWIANFFYSQCTETCPIQNVNMAMLQGELAGKADVRLVSISVDPEHDTPAFLVDYARRYNADPERWLFLTGAKDEIERLAIEGFRLGVVERPFEEEHIHPDGTVHAHKTAAGERVMHSSRFVLVDRKGGIRGYFRGDDAESLRRIVPAAKKLLAESQA
ncbi:MAG: SCO family protein [Betaproteobacteria bacterium]|nr:SCO family protein [Betaproteobacteria bacterium]